MEIKYISLNIEDFEVFRDVRKIICDFAYDPKSDQTLSKLIFRGHSEKNYHLRTTLERLIDNNKDNPKITYYREKNHSVDCAITYMLQDVIPTLNSRGENDEYKKNDENKKNFAYYLAYCQSYGGPSRLLDFSYSFDIATFFAIYKRKKKNASVFALNLDNILNCTFVDSANDSVEVNGKFNSWNILERFIKGENKYREGIYYFSPEEKTPRFIQQEGVFLFPSTLNRSFENLLFREKSTKPRNIELEDLLSNLEESNKQNRLILKINLNQNFHDKILYSLNNERNIRYCNLFPDREGLLKGLNFEIPFQDNIWPSWASRDDED